MTAPIGLRPGRESLETNLLERDTTFHCDGTLEDCREEECMKIGIGEIIGLG